MSGKIKHSGIVVSVAQGIAAVRILQHSACSSCQVASHCNAAETKEKTVEAALGQGSIVKPGDRVVVVADSAVGLRASLYAYLLPLLLMVVTLVTVLTAGLTEGVAAVSALGVLVPYYVLLYFLRGKLKQKLTFRIEPE